MVAYQIAFDLYESATQDFLRKVQEAIRGSMPPPPLPPRVLPLTPDKTSDSLETPVQETGEDMLPSLILFFCALLGPFKM